MQKITYFNETIVQIPSVCVIISSFNAEKYVEEQIESILNQKNVDINIWIRDDGSTDSTLVKLTKLYGKNPKIVIKSGRNLGAAESFLEAIFSCDFVCDYYAFSDADDVWISDKTAHSIRFLENRDPSEPNAIVTRLQIVDRNLNSIGYTEIPRKKLSFKNALVQTVASGAATTMNRAAFEKLRYERPRFVVMHDAWTYLVITAFGQFNYSQCPMLLYRQHSSNVFGANYSWRKRILNRIARLFPSSNPFLLQAAEFNRIYGDQLNSEMRRDVLRYLNYRNSFLGRVKFALRPSIVRQRVMSNLYMRLLILLGRE